MDLITYLPRVATGYNLVCIIVDPLSKYVYFNPYAQTVSAKDL